MFGWTDCLSPAEAGKSPVAGLFAAGGGLVPPRPIDLAHQTFRDQPRSSTASSPMERWPVTASSAPVREALADVAVGSFHQARLVAAYSAVLQRRAAPHMRRLPLSTGVPIAGGSILSAISDRRRFGESG